MHKKGKYYLFSFLEKGIYGVFLLPFFISFLCAQTKSIQGYSDNMKSGTAVIFVNGAEMTRVPLSDGTFNVDLTLEGKSHVLQVIIFDEKGNPELRKIMDVTDEEKEYFDAVVSIKSSVAAALAKYNPKIAAALEEAENQNFEDLVMFVGMVCKVINTMKLSNALSSLELIDRLLIGESLLGILQDRLGNEMGGLVLVELKRSHFPKDQEGNVDFQILSHLIGNLKASLR